VLLHETLLCIKALCTTTLALAYIATIHQTLFPTLLASLFSAERKGPSEYTTRNLITWLLFAFLKSASLAERPARADVILAYLRDPPPQETGSVVPFVLEMQRERPYRRWCKEATAVTKEVFWIFLHGLNVVSLPAGESMEADANTHSATQFQDANTYSATHFQDANTHSATHFQDANTYSATHFPREAPPVPAAPHVGSVEWDATNYLASHVELINGLIASLPSRARRNALRAALRISGWERLLGGSLRTCKEKFYGGVHEGLRCWVAAAVADGWEEKDVRCGAETASRPRRGKAEEAPKLKLDLGEGEWRL
jgi:hypothetical protein